MIRTDLFKRFMTRLAKDFCIIFKKSFIIIDIRKSNRKASMAPKLYLGLGLVFAIRHQILCVGNSYYSAQKEA